MTTRSKIEIIAAVIALLLAAVGVRSYIIEAENRAKAEAVQQAQATVIKQAQDDRAHHAKEDAARDAAAASTLATMQKALLALKTPQQQVAWSERQLEEAIKGIKITVSPTGEATATIPAASIPQLPEVIEQCKECGVKLATAQADLLSRDAQMKLADSQIQSLKTERDAALVAARGGTKWQRTVRTVKVIVIAGAAGYLLGHRF